MCPDLHLWKLSILCFVVVGLDIVLSGLLDSPFNLIKKRTPYKHHNPEQPRNQQNRNRNRNLRKERKGQGEGVRGDVTVSHESQCHIRRPIVANNIRDGNEKAPPK